MFRLGSLVLAVTLLLPASAFAAPKSGTFSGSLGVSIPRGAQADVRAVNRATGAVARSANVSRRGAFTLKLPPGAYTVLGTILPKEGRPTLVRSAVTLKAGQKRAKANLKKKRKRKPKARAAYVQELGQVTPGRIAVGVPTFTGPSSGDLHWLSRGLSAFTVSDLVGGASPCELTVVEMERRADVIKELEFQQSPYVDPSTRLTRNFIEPDIEVRGSVTPTGSGGDFTVTMRLVDTASGQEVGKVERAIKDNDRVFEQLEAASRALAEELCKYSDVYRVTINADGRGNFATHSGSGTVTSTLQARRAKDELVWTDSGPFQWSGLSVATKIPECPLYGAAAPAVTWSTTLRVIGEDQLQVTWDLAGNDMATATIDCVPTDKDDPDPPPIPGQPVVSMLNAAPRQFTLPVAGGTMPIAAVIADGSDGFFTQGTIEVKPSGVRRMG